ncbi:MAG: hypothetical protein DME33_14900 [Verrucomicrobia bacterium]|nr:MAG: hypothetical protein DME33_14900 [Verrucomicrobiota bacterium]
MTFNNSIVKRGDANHRLQQFCRRPRTESKEPGTYIYEPAGEAHTLVITDDSPKPMITMFVVEGGLIYLD